MKPDKLKALSGSTTPLGCTPTHAPPEDGMIDESHFLELLANMIATSDDEAKRLQESKSFRKLIFSDCQPPVREGDLINIHHFAQQHYVHEAGLPVDDESWDQLLFKEWTSSQQSNEALEGPTCLSSKPWIHEMLEEESKRTKGESWWSLPSSTDFVDPAAMPSGTIVTVGSKKFTVEGSIGRGGFGCIYRCYRQGPGSSQPDVLAMKVVDNKNLWRMGSAEESITLAMAPENAVRFLSIFSYLQLLPDWHTGVIDVTISPMVKPLKRP